MVEMRNPYADQRLTPSTLPSQQTSWEGAQPYLPREFKALDFQSFAKAQEPFVRQSFDLLYSPQHGHTRPIKLLNRNAEYLQLLRHYTFVDCQPAIEDFLAKEPSSFSLLNEAVEPLRAAFGEIRLIRVKAQAHDDDTMLRVTVQLPFDMNFGAEEALQRFDTDWWLENSHRSRGSLVFDYEIQDAV